MAVFMLCEEWFGEARGGMEWVQRRKFDIFDQRVGVTCSKISKGFREQGNISLYSFFLRGWGT